MFIFLLIGFIIGIISESIYYTITSETYGIVEVDIGEDSLKFKMNRKDIFNTKTKRIYFNVIHINSREWHIL